MRKSAAARAAYIYAFDPISARFSDAVYTLSREKSTVSSPPTRARSVIEVIASPRIG